MALRLRRGTDAERVTITPQAGELIYVIDTKKVWVGDGLTQGGVPVDTTLGSLSIDDLTDVDTTSVPPQNGQALVWNASNSEWEPQTVLTLETDPTVAGNLKVNIVGDDSSVLVDSDNNTLRGILRGRLFGDVYADNGLQMVDALNNILSANTVLAEQIDTDKIFTAANNFLEIKPTNIGAVNVLTVEAEDEQARIEIRRRSNNNIIGSSYDTDGSGGIAWTRVSPDSLPGGFKITAGIFAYEDFIDIFSNDTSPAFDDYQKHIVWREGKLGVGVNFPSESLETSGNIVVNGFIQGDEIKITNNNISTTSTNANLKLSASGTGTIELDIPTQLTVGAAGTASALPASPDIYFKINIGGTEYVVPGFAVS